MAQGRWERGWRGRQRGHGAYWLIPAVAVVALALSIASLQPIPIHYRAEALEAFNAFLQQPHLPGEFSREFCDRGMCISLEEAHLIEEAFAIPSPREYLEAHGFSCRETDTLLICLTPSPYPMPEGYRRVEVLIEKP